MLQQSPLLQPHKAMKSEQQLPALVHALSQKHVPLLDLPPHDPLQLPTGPPATQVGMTPEPASLHTLPAPQSWIVA